MNRKPHTPSMLGAGSLLAVFSVLCMVSFALLCISTVRSQRALSLASAEAVAGYYRAEAAAEELLARLRGGELPEGVALEDGVYSYACPISETQALLVRISQEDYTVLRWQAASTVAWEADEGLDVWSGDLE